MGSAGARPRQARLRRRFGRTGDTPVVAIASPAIEAFGALRRQLHLPAAELAAGIQIIGHSLGPSR